ncbi:MAG: hypothetical protein H6658_21205 [Ardenticatenaceae bacterium]|nr:hypothetical protein [Ardenticatenaceae bacterium]
MRKWTILLMILLLAAACGAGEVEPAAMQATPLPTPNEVQDEAADIDTSPDPMCTDAGDGRSLAIFPQEGRELMINGFDLPPGSQPTLRLTTLNDTGPDEQIERTPTVNEEGMFSERITLPEYDYMRWNVRLLHDAGVLCYYVVMGQDEVLEMGWDGPREEDGAIQNDLALMAEQTGIPLAELEAQMAYEDAITELQARLQANEAATYAGLWLEHEPVYRVVVAFTENGQETVAKYVAEGEALTAVLDIRPATYTQAQLMADQQSLNQVLETADFDFFTSVDVPHNRVELGVPTEEIWEAYVGTHDVQLPPSVVLTFAFPGGITFTPPPNLTPAPDIYMAQLALPSMAFMEALLEANLIVDNNCLLAQYPEMPDEKWLIIWQPGYYVHEADGIVQILDQEGKVVATVGEKLYMGGGEGSLPAENKLTAPIPEACHADHVWYMGEFLPEEYRD